jgi:DNA invertase Pin-like site-specific DNA recombinase
VARQQDVLSEIAKRRGFTIVRTIVENDTSATKGGDRAGFLELLDLIETGQVDVRLAATCRPVVWSVPRARPSPAPGGAAS